MKRLPNGLIENLEYKKDEAGNIDWLKMLPEKFLYINEGKKKELEARTGKPFEEIKIADVKETDLIILLSGIRFLADLRGYKYAKTKVDIANENFSAATCEICFIPNEEQVLEQIYTASASAHPLNTKSFYSNYLVEAATNRAFCRAVRNYLNINIVSKEELGEENQESTKSVVLSPKKQIKLLTDLMEAKKVKFDPHIIKKLKDEGKWDDSYKGVGDLPKDVIFNLLERIKAYPG